MGWREKELNSSPEEVVDIEHLVDAIDNTQVWMEAVTKDRRGLRLPEPTIRIRINGGPWVYDAQRWAHVIHELHERAKAKVSA